MKLFRLVGPDGEPIAQAKNWRCALRRARLELPHVGAPITLEWRERGQWVFHSRVNADGEEIDSVM